MNEVDTKTSVNVVVNAITLYLKNLYLQEDEDDKLSDLITDIELALSNYNEPDEVEDGND